MDGMIFYRSFADAIEELPADDYKELVQAVLKYGLDGEEPELTGVCRSFFALMRPQIDANNRRREAGRKGGEAKAENAKSEDEISSKPLANSSKPLANGKQNVAKEKDKVKDKEKEKDKDKEKEKDKDLSKNILSGKPDDAYPKKSDHKAVRDGIIDYLNAKTGKNFTHSAVSVLQPVTDRLMDGYSAEDLKRVIDIKTEEWKGTEMDKYLRPGTLFSAAHFEEYLNQRTIKPNKRAPNSFCDYPQHNYDLKELVKKAKED